jgi:hypothetical protein
MCIYLWSISIEYIIIISYYLHSSEFFRKKNYVFSFVYIFYIKNSLNIKKKFSKFHFLVSSFRPYYEVPLMKQKILSIQANVGELFLSILMSTGGMIQKMNAFFFSVFRVN